MLLPHFWWNFRALQDFVSWFSAIMTGYDNLFRTSRIIGSPYGRQLEFGVGIFTFWT